MKKPNKKELKLISEATQRKTSGLGLRNARINAAYIKKTIKDLMDVAPRPALVISAGPSLHNRHSLEAVKKSGFKGHLVAVDGTLGHCLRNGIVPDFVVTVDPHPHRIVRWFGDKKLARRPEDDYFRRQDLDPALNRKEVERNNELIELVDRYGPRIKAIISTSVSPDITKRCIEAGMDLYWWSPLYDDCEDPEGYSRRIYEITKTPCMVTGGNCGTSAWVFSHAVLKSPEVLLVGMDLSYPPGTDAGKVQYYDIFKEIFPENPGEGLIRVYNPYLKETWMTDPAYYWYSSGLIDMSRVAKCKTYNCTEGGILFGGKIEFTSLKKALKVVMGKNKKKGG